MVAAALALLAAGFAFVNGMNDGGSLAGAGVKLPGVRPMAALALLTTAVVIAPLLLGTAVATTLSSRLVQFDGDTGRLAFAVAVVVATGVVLVLARWGLPTSLTLAVVGALTGAGLGSGLAVSWPWVSWVLGLAAVAPLVGGMLALGVSRGMYRLAPSLPVNRFLRRSHRGAFALLCIAYGLNDGQKMVAVFALALALPADPVRLPVAAAIAMGACFALGAAVGLRRFGATLGMGVMAVRPVNAVIAEAAAGVAVLSTGLLGAPVSMTQAITGGLIGTGVNEGGGMIRWDQALKIAVAWGVTLPAALVVAAALSALFAAV